MALSVRAGYSRAGTSIGEIDPLRILAAVDPVTSDFDTRVLFSALWPTMLVETVTWDTTLPAAGPDQGTWSNVFYPSRKYATYPLVYACHRANGDGRLTWPIIFSQRIRNVYSGNYGFQVREMFQVSVRRNGPDDYFSVAVDIDQNGGWGLGGSGKLKLVVIGKGY